MQECIFPRHTGCGHTCRYKLHESASHSVGLERTEILQKSWWGSKRFVFFFFLWRMKLWALFHRTWRPMKDDTQGSELFIFHFKQIMLAAMRRLKATWLEPERFLESKWLRQVKDEASLAGIGIRWPGTERHRKSLWAERRGRRENDSSLTQAERHFLVLFTFKL